MTLALSDAMIGSALSQVAAHVEPRAAGAWTIGLMNGRRFVAHAERDDGWLVLDTALAPTPRATATAEQTWGLLERGAAGGARLALIEPGFLRARVDIPLDADVDLGARIREACRGLEEAKTLVGVDGVAPSTSTPHGSSSGADERLLETCRQTGWTVRRNGSGAIAVDLDVPSACHRATIESRRVGVVVSVPLFDDGSAPPETAAACRWALGVLLLRTAGAVRMVRATTPPEDSPCLEVRCGEPPSVSELSHALGALSVACRISARPALVLRHDERMAERYVRQWIDAQNEQDEKEERRWQ